MKKKCTVVMLSTEKASPIFEIDNELIITYKVNVKSENNKHLYILSEDEINEGDLFYHLNAGIRIAKRFTSDSYLMAMGWGDVSISDCKKLIATTDPDLNKDGIAKIPQSFIEKYITEYNKCNVINEVLIEYYEMSNPDLIKSNWNRPKTRSDNTVIIHKVKDTYTKEEVLELIKAYECFRMGRDFNPIKAIEWFNNQEF